MTPLPPSEVSPRPVDRYVGTLVGEATCRDFRLSIAHDAVREQGRRPHRAPYFARIAFTLSSGMASTVWPFPVVVVAMNIEL